MANKENKAKESLDRVIKNNPDNGHAHYLLGTIHENILDQENAINFYKKSIKLSPDNINAYK